FPYTTLFRSRSFKLCVGTIFASAWPIACLISKLRRSEAHSPLSELIFVCSWFSPRGGFSSKGKLSSTIESQDLIQDLVYERCTDCYWSRARNWSGNS